MSIDRTEMELIISANSKKLQAEIDKVNQKLGTLQGKGTGTGKSMGSMLTKMGLGFTAVGTATAIATKGIQAMLDKEDALADFSAITGVTGKKLEEFGDIATELSNTFGTSVVENIDSFKQILSRLGPDIARDSEAVKLMGENVNILSKATGLTAPQAMDALTTSMLQFGVDLSDPMEAANEMTSMMNVLAAGAKEGASEVPALSEAMKQVGSTAKSLNISFEETVASLETLALGGKQGAEAGVGLRNVMTSLTKVTKKGEQALKEIGLSTSDLGKTLTTDGVNEAMKQLNEHLKNVPNRADQARIKVELFGKENLASATTLLENASATEKYNDRIKDTQTAVEQATIKMNTMSEQAKRAKEGALNALVETFEYMGKIANEALVLIVNQLNQIAGAIGNIISLDFAGFWETVSISSGEYAKKQNEIIANDEVQYQLMLKKIRAQEAESKKRLELANLEKKLNDQLIADGIKDGKERAKHLYKLDELYKNGLIKTLDDYWLALADIKEENDKLSEAEQKRLDKIRERQKQEADKAIIDNLKERIDVEDSLLDKYYLQRQLAEEEKKQELERVQLALKANEITSETASLMQTTAGIKYDTLIKQYTDLINGAEQFSVDMQELTQDTQEFQDNIDPDKTANVGLSEDQLDEQKKIAENLQNRWVGTNEAIANSALATAGSLGMMFSGQLQGSDLLKQIAQQAIGIVQTLVLAADASLVAKGITTFGASLITDAPMIALAYAGLEALKAYVGTLEFEQGAYNIPRDLHGVTVHAGETILPKPFAEDFRAVMQGQGRKSNARDKIKVDMYVSEFRNAVRYSQYEVDRTEI